MRILLINDYATPLAGAELQIFQLRERLRARGHDARLFSTSASNNGTADYACAGTLGSFRTLLQTANPWALRKLRKVLKDFQPDVVHVTIFLTQMSPLILPVLHNIPSLYYAVWYRAVCPLGTKMFPDGTCCNVRAGAVCYRSGCLPLRDWVPLMLQRKMWGRWRHRAFNLYAANSFAVRDRLIADGIASVEVIWPGVEPMPQQPLAPLPKMIFAGRLVAEKGADVAILAFAKIKDTLREARFFIAGEGPQLPALRNLVRVKGLEESVIFLGHLPHTEVQRQFADAWVSVVPSRWPEPFGLSAAEAMMRGTAVIASNIGGLTEVVDHEKTGWLVTPGSVEDLSAAMATALSDRELAMRVGSAAREAAMAKFTIDLSVDRFVDLYKRLTGL